MQTAGLWRTDPQAVKIKAIIDTQQNGKWMGNEEPTEAEKQVNNDKTTTETT